MPWMPWEDVVQIASQIQVSPEDVLDPKSKWRKGRYDSVSECDLFEVHQSYCTEDTMTKAEIAKKIGKERMAIELAETRVEAKTAHKDLAKALKELDRVCREKAEVEDELKKVRAEMAQASNKGCKGSGKGSKGSGKAKDTIGQTKGIKGSGKAKDTIGQTAKSKGVKGSGKAKDTIDSAFKNSGKGTQDFQ